MKFSIADLIKRVIREGWEHKKLVTAIFVVLSFTFLALAWVWPRIYTSSSVIHVDQHDILSPLMEGTAVTSSVLDRARMARQVVFSRDSMLKIIEAGKYFDSEPTPIELDLKIEEIKGATEFNNSGRNLFTISFRNKDPQRAFNVATIMTSIFVDDTIKAKQAESREAYEFINNQVNIYHKKLQSAEEAIKEFRSRNVDSSAPGSKTVTNDRLLELKRQLEDVNLEIHSEESKLVARRKQLSGEGFDGISSSSLARETALNQRIVALESQLDTLRLDYHDTFPDIVQIKSQIETLKTQIDQEIASRENSSKEELKEGPIYQELRSQVLRIQTDISTLKSRKEQIEKLYEKEANTMEKINAVDAELAELTRDYTVNQELYQRLLRQRENALISMNIDLENQGLSIKVQEAATLPVVPKGIRFAHIILAGLVVSIGAPLALVFGMSLIDSKIRDEDVIAEQLRLPVLASVYYINTPKERRGNYIKASVIGFIVLSVWAIYAYAIWLRLKG